MAETSIQSARQSLSMADRYQVVVSVNVEDLEAPMAKKKDSQDSTTVSRKPTVSGAGSIARETVRRLSCDCSVSTIVNTNGEPTNIGHKTRVWPPAMARAIKNRDQYCQYPGCDQSQHLHIHHIRHWADGGDTSIDNGVCLCSKHHHFVHEGGYRIERVDSHKQRMDEQFYQQTVGATYPAFDVERNLRNSEKSFDKVRAVSATRFRFRVVDGQGRDILASDLPRYSSAPIGFLSSPNVTTTPIDISCTELEPVHSTRVDLETSILQSADTASPDCTATPESYINTPKSYITLNNQLKGSTNKHCVRENYMDFSLEYRNPALTIGNY